jgi:hypothetical protein
MEKRNTLFKKGFKVDMMLLFRFVNYLKKAFDVVWNAG